MILVFTCILSYNSWRNDDGEQEIEFKSSN